MANRDDMKFLSVAYKKAQPNFPEIAGTLAVNHFQKSFRDGGFTDDYLTKWKNRKRPDKKRPGRAILVDNGDLRRSIQITKKTNNYVIVGTTGIDYARVHNDGFPPRNIPKRQFMGDSSKLREKIASRFAKELFKQILLTK